MFIWMHFSRPCPEPSPGLTWTVCEGEKTKGPTPSEFCDSRALLFECPWPPAVPPSPVTTGTLIMCMNDLLCIWSLAGRKSCDNHFCGRRYIKTSLMHSPWTSRFYKKRTGSCLLGGDPCVSRAVLCAVVFCSGEGPCEPCEPAGQLLSGARFA